MCNRAYSKDMHNAAALITSHDASAVLENHAKKGLLSQALLNVKAGLGQHLELILLAIFLGKLYVVRLPTKG